MWNAEYGGPLKRIMLDENIFAFERERGNSKVTVILNLSKHHHKPRVDRIIHGVEVFTGKAFNFNIGDEIALEPWQYIVVTTQKQ